MKIHLKYPDRQIDMQDEDTSKNRQIDRQIYKIKIHLKIDRQTDRYTR